MSVRQISAISSPAPTGNDRSVLNNAHFFQSGESHQNSVPLLANKVPDTRLLSVDLEWEPLRKYLDGVMHVINQHAQVINSMYSEIRPKITEAPVAESFNRISDSINLYDTEFHKAVSMECDKPKPDNTGQVYSDSTNAICNKMNLQGHAITWLFKRQKAQEDHFKMQDSDIEHRLKKLIDEKTSKWDGRINALEKKFGDMEVQTLWKIKECEELLKQRVTEKFVNEAVKACEDRLNSKFIRTTEGNFEHFNALNSEVKFLIEKVQKETNDRHNNIIKRLDVLDDGVSKRLLSTKFEESRKLTFERLDENTKKIRDHQDKVDPDMAKISTTSKKQTTDISEMQKTILEMKQKLESMGTIQATLPLHVQFHTLQPNGINFIGNLADVEGEASDKIGNRISVTTKQGQAGGDPNKISWLENQINEIKKDLKDLWGNVGKGAKTEMSPELEGILKDFKKTFNQIQTEIEHLKQGLREKVDKKDYMESLAPKLEKDDVVKLIEQYRSGAEDRVRKLQKEHEEMKKKLDSFDDLVEGKFAKLKKDLDLDNVMKMLKDKPDDERLKQKVWDTERKLNALADLLVQLQKDYEKVNDSYNKLNQYIMLAQTSGKDKKNALLTTKSCLACGRGDINFLHPNHPQRGPGGKIFATEKGIPSEQEQQIGDSFERNDHIATSHYEARHLQHLQNAHDQAATIKKNRYESGGRSSRVVTAQSLIGKEQLQNIAGSPSTPQIPTINGPHSSKIPSKFGMRPQSAKPR